MAPPLSQAGPDDGGRRVWLCSSPPGRLARLLVWEQLKCRDIRKLPLSPQWALEPSGCGLCIDTGAQIHPDVQSTGSWLASHRRSGGGVQRERQDQEPARVPGILAGLPTTR